MKKFIFSIAMVCCLSLGAGAAFAAGPATQGGGYGQELTPQQLEQARKIFDDNYASMDTTRQALAAKRAELDAILSSPNPDSDRIQSLSREIGELRGKMLSARSSVRNQLSQQGLPEDYYGPGPRDGRYYDDGRVWHHGRGHGHWRGRPYGCGGCWW